MCELIDKDDRVRSTNGNVYEHYIALILTRFDRFKGRKMETVITRRADLIDCDVPVKIEQTSVRCYRLLHEDGMVILCQR